MWWVTIARIVYTIFYTGSNPKLRLIPFLFGNQLGMLAIIGLAIASGARIGHEGFVYL